MELREFVKTTVLELQGAISDITKESSIEYIFGNDKGIIDARGGIIKFDVAVEATEKSSGGGKIKVSVPVVNIGGAVSKSKESESSYTSRIQFELVANRNANAMHNEARAYLESKKVKNPTVSP